MLFEKLTNASGSRSNSVKAEIKNTLTSFLQSDKKAILLYTDKISNENKQALTTLDKSVMQVKLSVDKVTKFQFMQVLRELKAVEKTDVKCFDKLTSESNANYHAVIGIEKK